MKPTSCLLSAVTLACLAISSTTAMPHPEPLPHPHPQPQGGECKMCVEMIPPCPPCAAGELCARSTNTCQECAAAKCFSVAQLAQLPPGFSIARDPAPPVLPTALGTFTFPPMPTGSGVVHFSTSVGITVINGTTVTPAPTATTSGSPVNTASLTVPPTASPSATTGAGTNGAAAGSSPAFALIAVCAALGAML